MKGEEELLTPIDSLRVEQVVRLVDNMQASRVDEETRTCS
jgi:hypothetical protein